jgi:hypothetical protein
MKTVGVEHTVFTVGFLSDRDAIFLSLMRGPDHPSTHKLQTAEEIVARYLMPCGTSYQVAIGVATRMKNRRTGRRYDLFLPVMVRASIDTEAASRTGKTRDISAQGVCFTIDNDLNTGAELNLKITFPAEAATGGPEVFLKATGKVTRVDKRSGSGDQKVSAAVIFKTHEIVRN